MRFRYLYPFLSNPLATLAHCVLTSMVCHFSISLPITVPITLKNIVFAEISVVYECAPLPLRPSHWTPWTQHSDRWHRASASFANRTQFIFCDYHSLASRRTWRLHLRKSSRCLFTSGKKQQEQKWSLKTNKWSVKSAQKVEIMLKLLFYGLINVAIVWSLAIYYSVLVCLSIAKDWLLRFDQKPWQSKTRNEPPECLKDPKYGVHKYVRVNVSSNVLFSIRIVSLSSVREICVYLILVTFAESTSALRWERRPK